MVFDKLFGRELHVYIVTSLHGVQWSVEKHGFEVVENVVTPQECAELISAIGVVSGAGRRGLLRVPQVARLANSAKIKVLLEPHFGDSARPVRAIYFDKSPRANWSVTWHQDLLIAVQKRSEVPGFAPWSVKDGTPHVQPPVRFLEQMLTLRLHLDDADESNGALCVLPESHHFGQLSSEAIDRVTSQEPDVLCGVPAGGALLMRPLLLHASRKSVGNQHRRVIHLEYAGFDLPGGLQWHEHGTNAA